MSNNNTKLASLPSELVENILFKLSPNHLVRLKLVCKHLKLLIESARFINYYHNDAEEAIDNNSQLVSIISKEQIYTIELEKLIVGKSPNIDEYHASENMYSRVEDLMIGSCNGLLCFAAKRTILLYNPSTQAHYEIPNNAYSKVFSTRGSDLMYGLGYDPSTYDYKVVRLGGYARYAHVYSLKRKFWKPVKCNFKGLVLGCNFSFHSVFVNNALHWPIRFFRTPLQPYFVRSSILRFDLSSEEFSLLPQCNNEMKESFDNVTLDVLNKCLSALFQQGIGKTEIWIMERYGVEESWKKLVTIQTDALTTMTVNLIALTKDESKLFLAKPKNGVHSRDARLYCYNVYTSERIWEVEMLNFKNDWRYLLHTSLQSKLTLPLEELK